MCEIISKSLVECGHVGKSFLARPTFPALLPPSPWFVKGPFCPTNFEQNTHFCSKVPPSRFCPKLHWRALRAYSPATEGQILNSCHREMFKRRNYTAQNNC